MFFVKGTPSRAAFESKILFFAPCVTKRMLAEYVISSFLGQNAEITLQVSLHLCQETHFEDVVLHQVQLEVLLVGALELNDRDGLESLLDRRHYSQRV